MGREDKTSDDVTKPVDLRDLDDLSDLDEQTMSQKSVTQTADNVQFVTSIVLSRNGQDIATISEHFPVKQLIPDVEVTGNLKAGQGERGMLQLTWPFPSQAEAGDYKCDVIALSAQGQTVIFSETLKVAQAEVSFSDLVSKVHQLELEKEKMQVTIADQSNTIRDLNDVMSKSIQSLSLTDQTLNQSLTSLRAVARVEPDIFFTAKLTSDYKDMSEQQVLIFDYVISNEGQSYNSRTGVFTTPLDGFYEFHVHAVSFEEKEFYLALLYHDSGVMNLAKRNDAFYGGASNSVIVKLAKNEQLKVVCWNRDHGYHTSVGDLYDRETTFSGRLIALL